MGVVCSVCSSEREADFPSEYAEHGAGPTVGELYHVMEPNGTDHLFGIKRNVSQTPAMTMPIGKPINKMFDGSKLITQNKPSQL